MARADAYPDVSFDPAFQRGRTSRNVSNALPILETTVWRAPVDVAYEVDLWGRVRRSIEAAGAELEGIRARALPFGRESMRGFVLKS